MMLTDLKDGEIGCQEMGKIEARFEVLTAVKIIFLLGCDAM